MQNARLGLYRPLFHTTKDYTVEKVEVLSLMELENIGKFFKQHNLKLNAQKSNLTDLKHTKVTY